MEAVVPNSTLSCALAPARAFHPTSALPLSRSNSFRSGARSSRRLGMRSIGVSSTSPSSIRKLSVNCGLTEIGEKEFPEVVLKSDRPVLVEFVATWCGPCRLISSAMESIAQDYKDKLMVVKIDHDLNPRLIEEYKVYGLPTLIVFKNGQEVPESRREGAITKAKLKEYIEGLLGSVSVP